MKLKLITTYLCLITFYGYSQDTPSALNLQEAIDFALENNRQAKNAGRNIEAARQQKWETTSQGLPQIDAKIDYQNWLKQQVSLIPAEFGGGTPGEFSEVTFGTQQTMNATATLNQLIFDGSYLVGLKAAQIYLDISENAKEKTDLEVRKSVIEAYGNVLLANETIAILERNKSVLEKNVEETTKIYANGLEEAESVEQLLITLSSIESALNNANRLSGVAKQLLNLTLGIDVYSNITLTDNLESLTATNIELSLLSFEENIENNIDYKIAMNDKKSAETLLKLEQVKFLPSINGFINGGYTGNADKFNFVRSDQKWFGSSLVGVSMNIPIFSSMGRSAATQRAKINLEIANDDLTETEQKIQLEIASAKSDYQFSIEEYQNKVRNLELAERIEAKNQTKFFEGIASSFELRQAQTQLYSSQQDYLQAMVDVINKKAVLETVLNTINN
ncbi:MAG: transporter [Bacteroidetes bacterium MedPE-SWsnd-G2]|nr:MAG: transporter [Bacteroidetes bacterium MedPE-SWsnd-G2]